MDTADAEDEKEMLMDKLIMMVREGADGNEYQALLQRTNTWLKERCPDENWDLRSMYLLLLRYQQMHKEHQTAQLDAHEQSKECKSLRELLAEQSENARKEIEGLKRQLEDERATASAVERTLREHHARADTQWSRFGGFLVFSKYDEMMDEVRTLRDEVRSFAYSKQSRQNHYVGFEVRRVIDPSQLSIQGPDTPEVEDDMEVSYELTKPAAVDDQELSHFSPLPHQLSPFPTTLKTFSPLVKGVAQGEDEHEYHRGKLRGSRRDSGEERDKERSRTDDSKDGTQLSKTQSIPIVPSSNAISRFYEVNPPEGSVSLPHPAPASFYNKRFEKQREYSSLMRKKLGQWSPLPTLPTTPVVARIDSFDAAEEDEPATAPVSRTQRDQVRRETPPIYVNQTQTRSRNGSIYVQPQPTALPSIVTAPPTANYSTALNTSKAANPPQRPTAISRASDAAEALERRRRESGGSNRSVEAGQGQAPTLAQGSVKESATGFGDDGLSRRISLERRPSDRKVGVDGSSLRSRRMVSTMET
ncbi:hypothetical protein EW146_g8526 [Bondarzewia mesenterica]|uniref:Uncharacterized protein n=1 Tax=Bondarzewia mesenterica TaxID=1095465 RepID=A0A4S4LJ66_9AGAM|nr:hypothetical protein EW146_g8526 [Bondarzewia mesenterica]